MGEAVLKVVETFDGSKALKGNCKHIKGFYYEMNRQCFLMPDGKWNRVNNGLIAFDHRVGNWKFKNHPNFIEGIVGGTVDQPKVGYFTSTKEELVLYYSGRSFPLIEDDLVRKLDLVEDISSGLFVTRLDSGTSKNFMGSKRVYNYPMRLNYNSEDTLEDNINSFQNSGLNGTLDFYPDELEGVTYGFEIETWNGTVNKRHLPKVGLIPLIDGSLKHDGIAPYEYATVPLAGTQGLYTLKNAFDILGRYTSIGKNCSLHLHIGGYKKSKEFIISLYKTIKALEPEIFSLFPKFYEDTSQFKAKSYCGPLPPLCEEETIGDTFERFYEWLSMGESFNRFSNKNHPADPHGEHKWNISTRYYLINFIPFLFGKRGTIEFRVHPPTLNPIRAINWLFMCNAILKFANLSKDNWKTIPQSLTLKEIFGTVYDNTLSEYLNSYVVALKEDRAVFDSVKDYTGVMWCRDDHKFTFPLASLLTKHFKECPII